MKFLIVFSMTLSFICIAHCSIRNNDLSKFIITKFDYRPYIKCNPNDDDSSTDFHRNPYDCNGFYRCVNGKLYVWNCQDGLYFDDDKQVQTCIPIDDYLRKYSECKTIPLPTPSPTPSPTTPSTPSSTTPSTPSPTTPSTLRPTKPSTPSPTTRPTTRPTPKPTTRPTPTPTTPSTPRPTTRPTPRPTKRPTRRPDYDFDFEDFMKKFWDNIRKMIHDYFHWHWHPIRRHPIIRSPIFRHHPIIDRQPFNH